MPFNLLVKEILLEKNIVFVNEALECGNKTTKCSGVLRVFHRSQIAALICDFGGLLGLYVGFSFLTIFEFVDLALDLMFVGCLTRFRGNRSKTNQVDSEKTEARKTR